MTSYVNERELQDLVVQSPDLLTGEELATVDEFWIPGIGSVDIVGVAADGSLTIVECKLRANPEIRREVVGQLLAYAGGLWQMDFGSFAATWESRAGQEFTDHARAAIGATTDDATLRQGVATSLRDGSFTLVIAVDEITSELKRIIEYVNAVTRDEIRVLGLELQYVKEGSTEVLIPRTYGEGLKKQTPSASGEKWTPERFGAAVEALDDEPRSVVQALMQHGRQFAAHPWWGVGQVPGMSWYYDVNGTKLSLFQIYLRPNGVFVAPSLGGLSSAAVVDGRERSIRLLRRLRAFAAFEPYLAHVSETELNKYPSLPAAALAQPGGVDAFLRAVDEARAP